MDEDDECIDKDFILCSLPFRYLIYKYEYTDLEKTSLVFQKIYDNNIIGNVIFINHVDKTLMEEMILKRTNNCQYQKIDIHNYEYIYKYFIILNNYIGIIIERNQKDEEDSNYTKILFNIIDEIKKPFAIINKDLELILSNKIFHSHKFLHFLNANCRFKDCFKKINNNCIGFYFDHFIVKCLNNTYSFKLVKLNVNRFGIIGENIDMLIENKKTTKTLEDIYQEMDNFEKPTSDIESNTKTLLNDQNLTTRDINILMKKISFNSVSILEKINNINQYLTIKLGKMKLYNRQFTLLDIFKEISETYGAQIIESIDEEVNSIDSIGNNLLFEINIDNTLKYNKNNHEKYFWGDYEKISDIIISLINVLLIFRKSRKTKTIIKFLIKKIETKIYKGQKYYQIQFNISIRNTKYDNINGINYVTMENDLNNEISAISFKVSREYIKFMGGSIHIDFKDNLYVTTDLNINIREYLQNYSYDDIKNILVLSNKFVKSDFNSFLPTIKTTLYKKLRDFKKDVYSENSFLEEIYFSYIFVDEKYKEETINILKNNILNNNDENVILIRRKEKIKPNMSNIIYNEYSEYSEYSNYSNYSNFVYSNNKNTDIKTIFNIIYDVDYSNNSIEKIPRKIESTSSSFDFDINTLHENIIYKKMKNLKILVIDDNINSLEHTIENIRLIGIKLNNLKYHTNPKDALKDFKNNDYNIVFVDDVIPGTSGKNLISKMYHIEYEKSNSLIVNTKFILMNVYSFTNNSDTNIDIQRVMKPIPKKILLNIIREYLK